MAFCGVISNLLCANSHTNPAYHVSDFNLPTDLYGNAEDVRTGLNCRHEASKRNSEEILITCPARHKAVHANAVCMAGA